MTAFYDGKYDVLLSTAIVESGLDIPNANTLIVHRADMFGLAQLYQLRGRVGRSKARAYAYFTTPNGQRLTEGAEKRLKVLQSLDTLGAGFSLASHDLDIRGAGNLLGEEQSGHIQRGRLRALPVDAGGGGGGAEGRRPRRDPGPVEPADLARHRRADPGGLRRRPAACGSASTGASPRSTSAPTSTRFAAELVDRFGELPAGGAPPARRGGDQGARRAGRPAAGRRRPQGRRRSPSARTSSPTRKGSSLFMQKSRGGVKHAARPQARLQGRLGPARGAAARACARWCGSSPRSRRQGKKAA